MHHSAWLKLSLEIICPVPYVALIGHCPSLDFLSGLVWLGTRKPDNLCPIVRLQLLSRVQATWGRGTVGLDLSSPLCMSSHSCHGAFLAQPTHADSKGR